PGFPRHKPCPSRTRVVRPQLFRTPCSLQISSCWSRAIVGPDPGNQPGTTTIRPRKRRASTRRRGGGDPGIEKERKLDVLGSRARLVARCGCGESRHGETLRLSARLSCRHLTADDARQAQGNSDVAGCGASPRCVVRCHKVTDPQRARRPSKSAGNWDAETSANSARRLRWTEYEFAISTDEKGSGGHK